MSHSKHIYLEYLDVSGFGSGIGIDQDAIYDAQHSIELTSIKANHRGTGVSIAGDAIRVVDLEATHCTTAMSVKANVTGTQTPPIFRNLKLPNNGKALILKSFSAQWDLSAYVPDIGDPGNALGGTGAIADMEGSSLGLLIFNSSRLTVAGPNNPAGTLMVPGIVAIDGNRDLTFQRINVSGQGSDVGLNVAGHGMTISDITANDRWIGVKVAKSDNLSLRDISAHGSRLAGIWLSQTTLSAPLTGLTLTNGSTGLVITDTSETIELSDANGVDFGKTDIAVRVVTAPEHQPNVTVSGLVESAIAGGYTYAAVPLNECPTEDITSNLTLSRSMDCSGLAGGDALRVVGTNITIDGQGHHIFAPRADSVIRVNSDASNTTIRNIDVSSAHGIGNGIALLNTNGVTLIDVTANGRDTGVQSDGVTDLAITRLSAHRNAKHGLDLDGGTAPTLSELSLTHNKRAGLWLKNFDGSATGFTLGSSQFTALTGNQQSLVFDNVQNVTVSGASANAPLKFDGVEYGLNATDPLNRNLILENVDASAIWVVSGLNSSGIALGGIGHTVANVVVGSRDNGILLDGALDVSLTDVDAAYDPSPQGHGSNIYGLTLRGYDLGALQVGDWPTFSNVAVGAGNAVALKIDETVGDAVNRSVISPAELRGLDLVGSFTAIEFVKCSRLDVTGFTLSHRSGIKADAAQSANTDLRFVGLTLNSAGSRGGTGLALSGPGHRVTNVSVTGYWAGIRATAADGMLMTDVNSNINGTGLEVGALTSSHTVPTFVNVQLNDNSIGFNLRGWVGTASKPLVLDNLALGLDVTGSETGLYIDGAPSRFTVKNFTFDNPLMGVHVGTGSYGIFENLALSGPGFGTGMYIRGSNHTVQTVTADSWEYGLRSEAVASTFHSITATKNLYGLNFSQSSGASPTLDQLVLTNNYLGLSINGWKGSGQFVIDGTASSISLQNNSIGLMLFDSRNLEVRNFTLTSPVAGIWASDERNDKFLVEDVTVTGTGRGIGLEIYGSQHVVQNVEAGKRGTGVSVFIKDGLIPWTIDNIRVTSAAVYAFAYHQESRAPAALSNLTVTDSGIGFYSPRLGGSVASPLVLDRLVLLDTSGSLTSIKLGATTNVRLEGLDMNGSGAGLVANNIGNVGLELIGNDVTGRCRGVGVEIAGQGVTISRLTAARRVTGVNVLNGDAMTMTDSVIGANVNGIRVNGSSLATSIIADDPNYPSDAQQFRVGSTIYLFVGQTLQIGSEQGVVSAINVPTTRYITLEGPLAAAPSVGTMVIGAAFADRPRLAVNGSDICANGRDGNDTTPGFALHAGNREVDATGNYWRSIDGPTHVTIGGTGDFVTSATTDVDLTSFVRGPADLTSPYCNQTPVAIVQDLVVCEGDTVELNAGASYDPDCGADASTMPGCAEEFNYLWIQAAGQGVTLDDDAAALATYLALPLADAGAITETATFELQVSDDLLTRRAEATVTITRRNVAPTEASAGSGQTVNEGASVQLSGSGSDGGDGTITLSWAQTSGPTALSFNASDPSAPTFTAPNVDEAGAVMAFELTVTNPVPDGYCGEPETLTSTVSVTVNDLGGGGSGCVPGDPDCPPSADCDGVAEGTVIEDNIPCGCGMLGQRICEGGQVVSTCEPAYASIPDDTCTPAARAVAYAIVYDADNKPTGTIRCFQDLAGDVACDEEPDGSITVYNELWCTGVGP